MRIYISGKITGLPREIVIKKFSDAKKEYESKGYEVIIPTENICKSQDWYEQMLECLQNIKTCDAIHFLPCWAYSEGAKIEYIFAVKAGLKII